MPDKLNPANSTVQRLYDQDGLLDILLGVEEYFDGMDLYAYRNWDEGEIAEGPHVEKYWVEITLKFYQENFPDPRGLEIFDRQGTKILIQTTYETRPIEHPRSNADMDTSTGVPGVRKPKTEEVPVLLVKFQIPRRLVNPASFDEYKLMATDFNTNSLLNSEDEEPQEQPQPEPEQGTDDLDFDEMGGM